MFLIHGTGIFTYITHKNQLFKYVGKHTITSSYNKGVRFSGDLNAFSAKSSGGRFCQDSPSSFVTLKYSKILGEKLVVRSNGP